MFWMNGIEYVVLLLSVLSALVCLFVLTVLATSNSISAEPSTRISGQLMEVNLAEGFIVINGKRVYIGLPPRSAGIPKCSNELESLEKKQWVCLEVEQRQDRLWVTDLMPINRPTGGGFHGRSKASLGWQKWPANQYSHRLTAENEDGVKLLGVSLRI